MPKPSEFLPERVMERLWTAMRGNYGARWDRMFPVPPVPPAPHGVDAISHAAKHAYDHAKSVQAIWAEKLARFSTNLQAITFALDNLPTEPPNLPEFVALCNRRPDTPVPALPAPEVNQAAAQAALAEAAKVAHRIGDHLTPIRTLMAREIAGDKRLTKFQREFWRKALASEIHRLYAIDTQLPFDLSELGRAVATRAQQLEAA
jgi:hypothetical protein